MHKLQTGDRAEAYTNTAELIHSASADDRAIAARIQPGGAEHPEGRASSELPLAAIGRHCERLGSLCGKRSPNRISRSSVMATWAHGPRGGRGSWCHRFRAPWEFWIAGFT